MGEVTIGMKVLAPMRQRETGQDIRFLGWIIAWADGSLSKNGLYWVEFGRNTNGKSDRTEKAIYSKWELMPA